MIYILINGSVKTHLTERYWNMWGARLLREGWKVVGYMFGDKEQYL